MNLYSSNAVCIQVAPESAGTCVRLSLREVQYNKAIMNMLIMNYGLLIPHTDKNNKINIMSIMNQSRIFQL